MSRILVLGGVSYNDLIYVDRFPEPKPHTVFSQNYHQTIGGTGAGKALNLAKLGHQVDFHGFIGADRAGEEIKARLEAEGIAFWPEIDPQGTERHINLMDAQGERISIYVNYATSDPKLNLAQLEPLIAASQVVVLNIVNYCRHLIPLIKKHRKPIWCDIHDYDGQASYHQDFINAADYLFFSGGQLADYRAFMAAQLKAGKQAVVCTHGKKGATALSSAGWLAVPALKFKLVDSNGAGDSFFSGVLHGYLQGLDWETCLRYGSLVGGWCITSKELASPRLSKQSLAEAYQALLATDGWA